MKIGHGRYYGDVPPMRGVYQGGATSRLDASVQMSRLDPQAQRPRLTAVGPSKVKPR